MSPQVPNQFPTTQAPYRIAIVGEAPGSEEVSNNLPSVGASGRLLWFIAGKVGITRDACFVGNVCQVRPPNNDIKLFSWDGPEIQGGIEQLKQDLEQFKPHLVVGLGNTALRCFRDERLNEYVLSDEPDEEPANADTFTFSDNVGISRVSREAITAWRGSCFMGFGGRYKCMTTLHPAAALRDQSGPTARLMLFDFARARKEGETSTLTLPVRNLSIDEPLQIINRLDEIIAKRIPVATDIEGYVHYISCISFATSPYDAFIVPLRRTFWPDELWPVVWRRLATLLSDPLIPKMLQNCLYDSFVLQYAVNIPVRGIVHDTMLWHWERFCELPKSLATQASIYTRQPYWKHMGNTDDEREFWKYCCLDSAVTYEICNALQTPSFTLDAQQYAHYRFNMSMLEPVLYMELKGLRYDSMLAASRSSELLEKLYRLQGAVFPFPNDIQWWITQCAEVLCSKRAHITTLEAIVPYAKPSCLADAQKCVELLKQPLTLSVQGQLSLILGCGLNVESPKQVAHYLYEELGLPPQYKRVGNRKTDKYSTDVLSLLLLYRKTQHPILKVILAIRAIRTRLNTLDAKVDADGRIRCAYNVVGTETGRLTCYRSPTGSGYNLQTVASHDRDLFPADDGYYIFQCDLEGADGWTVAANCAACGDPTMLDDYLAGIKAYKIIALFYEYGPIVNTWSRQEIKEKLKSWEIPPWLSFAAKRVFHGGNYAMKEQTMSMQILKDSYKFTGEPIEVPIKVCTQLLQYKNTRWPGVLAWHRRLQGQLTSQGFLISAGGHRRTFLGRRDDYDTFKQACSDEPQNNTTYVTNLALMNHWNDPENRTVVDGKTRLIVQPLHTVHDALIGQFPIERTDWAVQKIRKYFDITITVAGIKVKIPFDGKYGTSWGALKHKL